MMNSRGHQVSDLLTALENTVQSASLADLPCLLGRLEQVKAVGWGRVFAGPHNGAKETELLTAKEVAVKLKISEYRAYELVRHGDLQAVRLGKSVRVKPSALAEYLAQHGG